MVRILLGCFSLLMCAAVKQKVKRDVVLDVHTLRIWHNASLPQTKALDAQPDQPRIEPDEPYLLPRVDPDLLTDLIGALREAYNDAKHPFIQTMSDVELLEDLVEEFEDLDLDNDGYISQEEFRKAYNGTDARVEWCLEADSDEDGEVDFTEFVTSKANRKADSTSSNIDRENLELLISDFKTLDADKDGHISRAERHNAGLKIFGSKERDMNATQNIEVDLDGEGYIDFAEFVKALMQETQ